MEARSKYSFLIIVIFVIFISVGIFFNKFITMFDGYFLKKEYVNSYLKKNYGGDNYFIKFNSSGKCLVSGDCAHSTNNSALGPPCNSYLYLNSDECKSYSYKVSINSKEFLVTVFDRNGLISVFEGKNVYGSEPIYKSPLYSFGLRNQKVSIDSGGTLILFTGISDDKSMAFISGSYSKLNTDLYMTTEYYDANNKLVGICSGKFMELVQKNMYGDDDLSFKCQIPKTKLVRGRIFDDIVYFRVIIS